MIEKRKQLLFSLGQFIILIALLVAIFAILYFKAYEYIVPSIIAFIILNIGIGYWVNKFVYPVQNKSYRQYLTVQTIFLLIWSPLLILILYTQRIDLVSPWIVILVAFYLGLGIVSCRKVLGKK